MDRDGGRRTGDGGSSHSLDGSTARLLDSVHHPRPITHHPEFVTFSGLIVDDIVLPDGRTYFNTLGGSGTHALVGMRVWSDKLGYFAAVGPDFDPAHRAQLEAIGIDLRGLIERAGARTPRAWQLFENDDRRIEVFRTSLDEFYRIDPVLEELPAAYLQARGFHLNRGTPTMTLDLATRLRAANPDASLVWEPTPLNVKASEEEFRAALPLVDLISPDLGEAREMTGRDDPEGMIAALLDWGARIVALRMGARGSRVATADGAAYDIPAAPVMVVDTTGAGDAYCGGFLAALGQGDDLAIAAARASVSASFAIEQFGIPAFEAGFEARAEERLAWVRERITSGKAVS